MINTDLEIAALIAKYISKKISSEELSILTTWREEKIANELLFQKICNSENQKLHYLNTNKFNLNDGWNQVNSRIKQRTIYQRIIKISTYAAIIALPLLLISSSLFLFSIFEMNESNVMIAHNIAIGQAKAILTLENGEVINITNSNDLKGCNGFTQSDSSTLHFQDRQEAIAEKEIKYNTIEIPHGGEYKLILSDGTRVHLNSLSSLRFPVTFSGNCRKVELIGEAYFEVAHTDKPFIVNVNSMHIDVLGTVFNVSAYPDKNLQTTLVSGSVKLHTDEGNEYLLKPYQQATLSLKDQKMNIKEVNIETYTSWIKGLIHFKDERLEDIMNTLSRWYDMDIIYKDERIKNLRFGCFIDKYSEISSFIDLIKKTEKIKAKIEGKTISFYN